MLREPASPSATIHVHAILRDRIGRAELPPGAPLRQDRIATEFGISHVPVREALAQLTCEGLVTTHRNRGSTVSVLSAPAARELAEYRSVLEAGLIRWAIPHLARDDIARAGAVLDELERATALDRIVTLNAAFHAILYARAERPFILRAVETARLNLGRYLWLTWQDVRNADRSQAEHRRLNADRSQAEHRRLLAFCEAGAADAAAELMAAHLRATGEEIARLIADENR